MEPVGSSDEVQAEERSPEEMAGRRPTKAEPGGRGSLVELMDRWVTVEAREPRWSHWVYGPRLEVDVRDSPATAMMGDGRPAALAPY